MTEQSPSAIGTVAQEAARLIEDMAAMVRSSHGGDDRTPQAGEPAQEAVPSDVPHSAGLAGDDEAEDYEAEDHEAGADAGTGDSSARACSVCGAERDDTPASCRLCPLCRGIALLRSVRPETVDLMADLALSLAASLRDVATRSRASDSATSSRPAPGSPPDGERRTVQDIPVDDESE